jgi:hypothetical protein
MLLNFDKWTSPLAYQIIKTYNELVIGSDTQPVRLPGWQYWRDNSERRQDDDGSCVPWGIPDHSGREAHQHAESPLLAVGRAAFEQPWAVFLQQLLLRVPTELLHTLVWLLTFLLS